MYEYRNSGTVGMLSKKNFSKNISKANCQQNTVRERLLSKCPYTFQLQFVHRIFKKY